MENNSLFTTRQLTEYREWSNGKKGYLHYVNVNSDFLQQSGIYLVDENINPQIMDAILLDPLAHYILDEKNPLDNLWYLSRGEWINYLISTCRNWLARNKQVLNEYLGAKRIQEYDKKLRFIILKELETQNKAWPLRIMPPIEIKDGFIPFFYNFIASGTILEQCKQSITTTDYIATQIIRYLHKDGEVYPLEHLSFDCIEDERRLFKDYVEKQLHNLARRTGNNSIYIEESTEWLSNQHRKELLAWELECYEKNKIIFDILPSPQSERFFEYTKAFFYHMLRYIDFPDQEIVDKVKMCINGVYRKSDLSNELLKQMPNLPFPPKEPRWSKAIYMYIMTRKKYDKEFALFCNHRTLVDVCNLFSASFKVVVDPGTFGRWLNRNKKSLRD